MYSQKSSHLYIKLNKYQVGANAKKKKKKERKKLKIPNTYWTG